MNGLTENTAPAGPPADLFAALTDLADVTRGRVLRLLERHELSVSDLCAVLQLPQSTVSRHLKTLADGGWAVSRPAGTRRLYRADAPGPDTPPGQLWELLRRQVEALPNRSEDDARTAAVLARRHRSSASYFDASADAWDGRRDELFGPHFYLFALMGLLEPDCRVGDLGCGTGPVAEALAPFVREVVAVDASPAMLDLARRRLQRFDNVRPVAGDLEALPLDDSELDVATLCLVLHHLPRPERVIGQVARVLRPGGRLLIVDMVRHEREDYRREMGHVWLGFERPSVEALLAPWFEPTRWTQLPARPRAMGPSLFATTAVRNDAPFDPAAFNDSDPDPDSPSGPPAAKETDR